MHLDPADGTGEDDVHAVAVALLVVRGKLNDSIVVEEGVGGKPVGVDHALDAARDLLVAGADGRRRAGDGTEPDGDRGAVAEREAARGLNGVADRVAEVERLANAALLLVGVHDVALYLDVPGDDGGEGVLGIAAGVDGGALELGEEVGVCEHAVLDDLAAGVGEQVVGT